MRENRRNNFDFIRFAAATMVWHWHCYALSGRPAPALVFGGTGVAIFFIISGYLITASYDHKRQLLPFLRNRALRIFPAMMVVILLCVFLLGPCVTSLSLPEYFAHPMTWRYLRSLLVFPLQYELPGVFTDNPVHAVNGSLWTLQHELRCYAIVAIIGVAGLLRPRLVLALFAALWCLRICGALAHAGQLPHPQSFDRLNWGKIELAMQLELLFGGGALMYLLRDRLPLQKNCFAAACLLLALSACLPAHAGDMLFDFVFPYVVIFVGCLPLKLHDFGRYGDFSYGMYLYAFPVQQLTLMLLGTDHFLLFMAVSFFTTLLCAVLSWRYVEKPALKLKKGSADILRDDIERDGRRV